MDSIPQQLSRHISLQQITDYRIHIHLSPTFLFLNTIILESRWLIPPVFRPIVLDHPHPQNSIHPFPFAVFNHQTVQNLPQLLTHIIALTSQDVPQLQQEGEERVVMYRKTIDEVEGLVALCEELAQIATATSEDEHNSYYVFMNPIFKWREYRKEEARKKRLISLQALHKDGTLNGDWVVYKLQLLQKYYLRLSQTQQSSRMRRLHKIVIVALLKHLKVNRPNMHKAALQQKTLQTIQSQKLTFLLELQQAPPPEPHIAAIFHRNFTLQAAPKPKQQEQSVHWSERWLKAMVLPVSVTSLLLVLRRAFSM